MRVLVQRVSEASVSIDGIQSASIGLGFLLLVGFTEGDTSEKIRYLAGKVAKLRVFADQEGKMNQNILSVGGEILSVSQFTLYANLADGNRPSFTDSLSPEKAILLYDEFNALLAEQLHKPIKTGVFGAHMMISLVNDGPVTIMLER
jgi:D-tyrosyl-tRNA(Tyr) deacylase